MIERSRTTNGTKSKQIKGAGGTAITHVELQPNGPGIVSDVY
jgi:hypothetical protein